MVDRIPKEISEFIIQYIASVAELEGLLLLREEPEKGWDKHSLAERLYIEAEDAERILSYFSSLGFLHEASDRAYFYKPKNKNLIAQVDAVAEIYSRYLVPVTNLIHMKSKKRVQQFADAFRIRKDT